MMRQVRYFISRGLATMLLVSGFGFSSVYGVDEGGSVREAELARARMNLEHAKAALYEARKTLALLMEEQGSDTTEQGFLGIFLIPSSQAGVRVTRILPDAAAAKAGIEAGDLVTAISGKPLGDSVSDSVGRDAVLQGAYDALANVRPGDEVQMSLQRGNRHFEAILIAEARRGDLYCEGDDGCRPFRHEPTVPYTGSPELSSQRETNLDSMVASIELDPEHAATVLPFMEHYGRLAGGLPKRVVKGLELAELNAELGRYFGASHGVLVVDVMPEAIPGVQGGDVILSCGGRVVRSPRQIMRILMNYEQGDEVELTLMRDQRLRYVSINLSETTASLNP
ncbi:MAG: PDZ domain-containing protein [Porticoccaceae bacterium]|nr:PDZ domain-containing protein [Porticoccaceae bacterium]